MIGWIFVFDDGGHACWHWATAMHLLPFPRREEAIIAGKGRPGRLILAKARPHNHTWIGPLK